MRVCVCERMDVWHFIVRSITICPWNAINSHVASFTVTIRVHRTNQQIALHLVQYALFASKTIHRIGLHLEFFLKNYVSFVMIRYHHLIIQINAFYQSQQMPTIRVSRSFHFNCPQIHGMCNRMNSKQFVFEHGSYEILRILFVGALLFADLHGNWVSLKWSSSCFRDLTAPQPIAQFIESCDC